MLQEEVTSIQHMQVVKTLLEESETLAFRGVVYSLTLRRTIP